MDTLVQHLWLDNRVQDNIVVNNFQEVIDHVPQSLSRSPAPSASPPHVPAVPECTPTILSEPRITDAGNGCPRLVAVHDGLAATPLQTLAAGFSDGHYARDKPQKPIAEESVKPSRWVSVDLG